MKKILFLLLLNMSLYGESTEVLYPSSHLYFQQCSKLKEHAVLRNIDLRSVNKIQKLFEVVTPRLPEELRQEFFKVYTFDIRVGGSGNEIIFLLEIRSQIGNVIKMIREFDEDLAGGDILINAGLYKLNNLVVEHFKLILEAINNFIYRGNEPREESNGFFMKSINIVGKLSGPLALVIVACLLLKSKESNDDYNGDRMDAISERTGVVESGFHELNEASQRHEVELNLLLTERAERDGEGAE